MKATATLIFLTMISALLLPVNASAESRYISDVLWVPLRSGPGSDYRIINRGLKSGTELEFVETNEDDSWTLVRRGDLEGWIPTRYLREDPIAAQQLAIVTQQLNDLRNRLSNTTENLQELRQDSQSTSSELEALEQEKADLTKELNRIREISANAIELNDRNNELLEENQLLKNEVDVVKLENQRLEDAKETREWMVGGSIMLIGLILGLILPKLKGGTRRDSWA